MTAAAADTAERRWSADGEGVIRLGSEAHKVALCRLLLETHNPYTPAVIDWPRLDDDARGRLVALPIWDIAVQTEGKASIRVATYGKSVADPLLREAILLNGFEEGRHKLVLSNLVEAYGIRLGPEPEYLPPRNPEWAFMVTGFSECIDSFFAFGLFALARRSAFFPPELVETFEPIMQEEARHILFFVNWVAWHRRSLVWWRRPWFWGKVLAVWVFLAWERIGLARSTGKTVDGRDQDNSFTMTGSKAVANVDLSPGLLFALCLEENRRRMAGYDPRLLRPQVMPRLIGMLCRLLRLRQRPAAAGG